MTAPHLLLLGASHHTAPLALRERLALTPEKAAALSADLRGRAAVSEYCILGTCNRLEIYACTAGPAGEAAVIDAFCAVQQLTPAEFAAAARVRSAQEAVSHLFAVAAGLDSQMVGETEILGQVKAAYAAAQAAGSAGPVLNRVFQKALHSAKIVRSETAIGEGQVSVATVAVALAAKIFGDLRSSRALVLGAGDIAEKTAKALRSREAGTIVFANRTPSRAEELAREFQGSVLPLEELARGLAAADIVVCSAAAPAALVTPPLVRAAIHSRPSRPLFLIDLALPRNVDPAAALPNVFLYNLDDLARIAEENIAQRQAEITRARALVTARASAVWSRLGGASPPPPPSA